MAVAIPAARSITTMFRLTTLSATISGTVLKLEGDVRKNDLQDWEGTLREIKVAPNALLVLDMHAVTSIAPEAMLSLRELTKGKLRLVNCRGFVRSTLASAGLGDLVSD
jgi:hypothetical protein